MDNWYRVSGETALRQLHSGAGGLTGQQAEELRRKYGGNVLEGPRQKRVWQVFLGQFQDLLVMILLAAAAVSMVSGSAESTVVIFVVILLNAVLGTVQHEKARRSLDSLKALSSPAARVLRDGQPREIPSAQVVPGDILLLEAGDLAAADGRLLECVRLTVNESSLTGEPESVAKQAGILDNTPAGREEPSPVPLADQTNMIFSGSLITGGRGRAVVTATGMDTEIGKIASLMNAAGEKKTPLQASLDQFGSRLALGILLICGLVFALNLYRKMPVLDSLMFAVALAVAAIPEALGSIVTIVQAMGTRRMAKEHAIIKDLKAVESLGCVSVICTDKTGTLTQNRMHVQEVWTDGQTMAPDKLDLSHPAHRYLLAVSVLANDAVPGPGSFLGDPTETALLELGQRAGADISRLRREYPRLGEIPFDSSRKTMSTLHHLDGRRVLLTKGAPDILLARSSRIMTAAGIRPMTDTRRRQLEQQNLLWSRQGLRVLAMAAREAGPADEMEETTEKSPSPQTEQDFVFVGMTALMDPPRPESRTAVRDARRAGIRPVMITGDHKATAVAVARKIGLFREGDRAVTGRELDAMDEDVLRDSLERISVYARVSPEHKLRIVEAWQSRGHIVAMTGDGVNDAPALKKADIGVAMGLAGTEVSKEAASMILADDNFATILRAVANGRSVYRNIRHAVQFLLSGNMAGILCVLYTSLRALPMPFAPVHLLFINLLTDSLPAIAIGMEPQEESLLDAPPRDPKEGILTASLLARILAEGGLIALCTILSFHAGLAAGGAGTASTMAFATLTLARLFHGFNCRGEQSLLYLGLTRNLWSIMAFETGLVLLAAVLFLPGLQVLFAAAALSLPQLVTVLILAFLPTAAIQAARTI